MSMNTGLANVLQHVNSTSESFISAYYTAWDKDRPTLSSLYTPNSRIVWNGNPISGLTAYEQFIAKMPATKHDIQAYDCHPLPGSSTEGNLSSIIVNVSGTLQAYNAAEGEPPAPPARAPGGGGPRRRDPNARQEDIDTLPRLFSQSFVLCPQRGQDGTLMYIVQTETFRFVG